MVQGGQLRKQGTPAMSHRDAGPGSGLPEYRGEVTDLAIQGQW